MLIILYMELQIFCIWNLQVENLHIGNYQLGIVHNKEILAILYKMFIHKINIIILLFIS